MLASSGRNEMIIIILIMSNRNSIIKTNIYDTASSEVKEKHVSVCKL